MRIAGRIVDRMHQRILETARPGIPKDQVVAEVYQTGISGIEGAGGDYPSIVPLVCAGAEAATPHLTWNSELLRRDEGVFFEVAGVHKRYHCPTSRTLYFGKPPKKFIEAEKAVLEGIDAGLDRAQPGQRCEDISKAFFDTMARHGVHKEGRCGYGIGLSYPPDWGEHTFSLRPGDDTVLAAGMAFHFMPALWFDDWGLEITETVLITGAGHECLSHVERKLLVVD